MISYAMYAFFFLFCLALALLINRLLLKFAQSLGVRNNNELGQVRWSAEVKPSLGGLSFFLVFLIAVAAAGFLPSISNSLFQDQKLLGVIASTTLGFIIGLADDSYNTNPLVKFMGQLTCAFILIFSNLYIVATGNPAVDYFVTILWVVGLMNSINMLDNMDGITATAAIVILLAALAFLFLIPNSFPPLVLIVFAVLAALFGFLFFNWNPAKMYMGDTGSQFLGVFLAAVSIFLFWNERNDTAGIIQIRQFVLPLLIFTVPLMDTLTVFIRRLMRGQSPFVGGKDHTTHQLVFFGFSERQTAWILIAIGLVSGSLAVLLYTNIIPWTFLTTILAFAYFFLVFGVMQVVYNIGKKRHEDA
jgi:UDP-GlcNAc:undecaprenyl-phosphate GlcNAc-1-phosphate transferase